MKPSHEDISIAELIAESKSKKLEKVLEFRTLRTPVLLGPAVENIKVQHIEFYEALSMILSDHNLSIFEKYKSGVMLKRNTQSKIIDILTSYGDDVLDPDGELCLEEIYFCSLHEYEKMVLNIAQCAYCENMRHKQILSDKLDVLQEQPGYPDLNEKQLLAQFNAYTRSFRLSKDLAMVEKDALKLQDIGNSIKTAKTLLMLGNKDSDVSDFKSKEINEAAVVNFAELMLTDTAQEYLDVSPASFLQRLYSSQERVSFRELFAFCDALRGDQTITDVQNHTQCRLPNIWASDCVIPALLTLAIPHGGNGGNEPIQDPNVLSQIRAAFRDCGITIDLVRDAINKGTPQVSHLIARG